MKAVRFDEYGGVNFLRIAEVPNPEPTQGEVLVQVKAAAINPGEAKIREGLMHSLYPATFPSGEGSDLAGIVARLGPGVAGVTVGDEVIGFTNRRASHAEYVVVEAQQLTSKPANVSWETAGSLAVAGGTAFARCAQCLCSQETRSRCRVRRVAWARWPSSWPGWPGRR